MLSEFVLTFKLSVFYFPLQCLRVPIVCKGGEGGGHYDNDSDNVTLRSAAQAEPLHTVERLIGTSLCVSRCCHLLVRNKNTLYG